MEVNRDREFPTPPNYQSASPKNRKAIKALIIAVILFFILVVCPIIFIVRVVE
jgi:hypothetical protein